MGLPATLHTKGGHALSLRRLDPADMLDLIEAGGSAMNGAAADAWLGYAEMICSVTAIDQIPVHMPSSKEEIKELARRLGHDGVDALLAAFEETATPRLELLDVSKN